MNEDKYTEEVREDILFRDPTTRAGYDERASEVRSTEGKSASELEADLARIRQEMDYTIRTLEQKFSPSEIVDRIFHSLGKGPADYAGNLGRHIRDNPIPATLAGISLAWLMVSTGSPSYTYRTKTTPDWKEKNGGIKEKLSETKEKLSETASRIGSKASEVSHSVQEKKRQASEKFKATREEVGGRRSEMYASVREMGERSRTGLEYIHEHPLLLGAIGIAVGSIIGAALPPTRKEDQLFGEKRDEALQQAKEFGKEQAERGRTLAKSSLQSACEEPDRLTH
jgi:ElaB/YqjD/DUF883 family membrane-anchored ribosome-binding protein